MIINLRGTNGSGKTTVVRGLMKRADAVYPIGKTLKPDGYVIQLPELEDFVLAVGSYENTCGGCDQVGTAEEVCSRIRKYAQQGHVVFEGYLATRTYGRYRDLDREHTKLGIPFIWAFLDTPVEICVTRVQGRRLERGNTKPLNTFNLRDTWDINKDIYNKMKDMHLDVRWLDHRDPVSIMVSWIQDFEHRI